MVSPSFGGVSPLYDYTQLELYYIELYYTFGGKL